MSGLFISAEHQETVAHRQHPGFRGTFYILMLLVLVQLPMIGLGIVQVSAASKEKARAEAVIREHRVLDADEQLLVPITRRIEQAAEWRTVLSQRKRVGEVLAKLEASVTPSTCLSQITIRNQTSAAKRADRLDIKVVAWVKGEAKDLEEKLNEQFPGYLISAATLASSGNDTEGSKVIEVSVVAQADSATP